MRHLSLLETLIIAGSVFMLVAFAFGSAVASEPHSHWALAIEREDGSGRILAFNDEAECLTGREHVTLNLEEVTLMSECLEVPLLPIKREPVLQGERT